MILRGHDQGEAVLAAMASQGVVRCGADGRIAEEEVGRIDAAEPGVFEVARRDDARRRKGVEEREIRAAQLRRAARLLRLAVWEAGGGVDPERLIQLVRVHIVGRDWIVGRVGRPPIPDVPEAVDRRLSPVSDVGSKANDLAKVERAETNDRVADACAVHMLLRRIIWRRRHECRDGVHGAHIDVGWALGACCAVEVGLGRLLGEVQTDAPGKHGRHNVLLDHRAVGFEEGVEVAILAHEGHERAGDRVEVVTAGVRRRRRGRRRRGRGRRRRRRGRGRRRRRRGRERRKARWGLLARRQR